MYLTIADKKNVISIRLGETFEETLEYINQNKELFINLFEKNGAYIVVSEMEQE